jgi:hypothetical protein
LEIPVISALSRLSVIRHLRRVAKVGKLDELGAGMALPSTKSIMGQPLAR